MLKKPLKDGERLNITITSSEDEEEAEICYENAVRYIMWLDKH
ncbi:MAG: hypothetical protein ABII07_02275 [Patescibacteria group bacterium]